MSALFDNPKLRRTITLLLVTDFLWGLGNYFVLSTTTIPEYLRSLGASYLLVGVMATAFGALVLLPQLFGRAVLERFANRKRGIIILHLGAIAPYLAVAVMDIWLAGRVPGIAIALTIVLLSVSQIIIGIILPVWLDMIAQVIPLPIRGQYFGATAGCFALGGILGSSALVGLQRLLGAGVFRAAFLTAVTFFLLAMLAYALAPIPAAAFDHPAEIPLLQRVKRSLQACGWRTDFGRLAISYFLHNLAVTIVPFLVVYASDAHRGLHLGKGIFSFITLCEALGGTAGALLLGWLVDRLGPRWPWVGVTLIIPVVVLFFPFGANLAVLSACSLLAGLLVTHWSVAGPALLELSPPGDKSGYVAIANAAAFVPAAIGPIIMAGLIGRFGYHAAFLFAAIAGLTAFIPAISIRNRACRAAEETPHPAPIPVDQ